jgi:hypothetical protein
MQVTDTNTTAVTTFQARVASLKANRAIGIKVVDGHLQLLQPPADVIIIERDQISDFLLALNGAVSSLFPPQPEGKR